MTFDRVLTLTGVETWNIAKARVVVATWRGVELDMICRTQATVRLSSAEAEFFPMRSGNSISFVRSSDFGMV